MLKYLIPTLLLRLQHSTIGINRNKIIRLIYYELTRKIGSWKLLTPQTVSLTIRFWIPEEVAMEGDSVELFVKPALKQATTVKFAPIDIQ
ncbi:hypothetical protein [Candidatus Parabeggiatoa sp. HSG14]|uniref:hypothetical protein n=1 Tax=Candidatus Parabeggiatoa sp. HSG14 TaxID=3055593 RepID=UPI0025A75063|nr:hypothetical protein [Thiotrichales bacterium HSG14]